MEHDSITYNRRATDVRLERIETKLDELGKVLIALARTEEKVHAMEDDKIVQWEVLNKLEAKIDIMEVQLNDAARTMKIIHKFFWIAVAGAATYFMPSLLGTFPV